MNVLEKLMAEYDHELTFVFRNDMPDNLHGLLVDDTIYINAMLHFEESVAVLAEEIGHHKTLAKGNICDYSDYVSRKLEAKGREWGYRKLVSKDKLKKIANSPYPVESYEVAEELGLPEDYVEEAIEMYKVKEEL